jgi:glycosyltransferase involved in cell wall biosynthesis
MRILFVSPCNGIGAHEERFLTALSENGYVTRVFAYHSTRLQDRLAALPGVSVDFVPLRVAGRLQRVMSVHVLPRLKKTIKEFHPDLIHAGNSWNDSFLAGLTGFHPLLVMPYGSDVLIDPDRWRVLDWFNRSAFRAADLVTVDAERVKDTIVRRYGYPPDKIAVIPWGINVENIAGLRAEWRGRLRQNLGWDSKFVVMMNRHHEAVYGIDVFLRAMVIALRENPDIRVLFIGAGSLTPQYREFVSQHDFSAQFFMPGKIPRDMLYQYLHAADLYVSSSHSDGTSVSLLEAMAARLGVVVTDVPAILEWVTPGANGEVVGRGDEKALAAAILRASRNPAMVSAWGEQSLSDVRKRADWRENFKAFEVLYRTLVPGEA